MATNTPLQSIVLTDVSSSITFSNIDQTYTDLVVVVTASITTGTQNLNLRFNGDSTSGLYSATWLTSDASSASSSRQSSVNSVFLTYYGYLSTTLGIHKININNYSNTTTNKSFIARTDNVSNGLTATVGLWRNLNAITSVTLFPSASTFAAGATFDLYGIKSGAPKAFGGDLVTTDGNYWYHAFKSSGTFLLQRPTSVDYLVVAGGGGGGKGLNAGAGGAGGLRSTVTATGGGGSLESALSMAPGSYTVTVGAGGAGGVSNGNNGTVGSNSILSSITSTGGGYGGGPDYGAGYNNGGPGGSGGGGGLYNTLGGAASPSGQGYAGGASVQDAGGVQAGGGGGAGAVGTTGRGTGPVLGTGGAGLQLTAFSTATNTGASGYYAGGGGGGANAGVAAGGAGGGGTAGAAGTINTGGGGGGAGNSGGNTSGAGGSGIVIVRYAV